LVFENEALLQIVLGFAK